MPITRVSIQATKRMNSVAIGLFLLASGLALNYLLERHNVFKVWENSPYPISWADLLYPPVCVLLCLTGVVFALVGGDTPRKSLAYAAAFALALTVLYTIFAFAMQFVASGADRLGECTGLDEAASSSNVIPESKWGMGRKAVGCAVERRGIFLTYYNDLDVSGVTDSAAQQVVLDKLTEHHRQAHTHPVQVRFFEKENVSVRKGRNGAAFRSAGPVKLIRVVNIG